MECLPATGFVLLFQISLSRTRLPMLDTKDQNRQISLSHYDDVWLFGYGSLIFKVDFPYLERRLASIEGWERRFWQGSHDHRGTPTAPGRVVTLTEVTGAKCTGMAYRVTPDTFAHLDHREKNGYLRFFAPLCFPDEPNHPPVNALVYVAAPDNAAYLGPSSIRAMAQHILDSHGPSGANVDYLLELDDALTELGIDDEHVRTLARAARELSR